MPEMLRVLSIVILFAKQSLGKMLAYRITAAFTILFGILFAAAEVVAIVVYYQYTDEIAGWDLTSFLMLYATFGFIQHLYQFMFVVSHEELMDKIIEGELDYELVRPLDSQFLCSVKTLDYPSLINMLIPLGLLIYSVKRLGLVLTTQVLIPYTVLMLLGVWLYYLLNQFFVVMAFWVERPRKLAGVPEFLFEFASRPRTVYPRALQVTLTLVLPVLTAVNAPVELLRGEFDMITLLAFVVALLVMSVIVRVQWLIGIRRYASAS